MTQRVPKCLYLRVLWVGHRESGNAMSIILFNFSKHLCNIISFLTLLKRSLVFLLQISSDTFMGVCHYSTISRPPLRMIFLKPIHVQAWGWDWEWLEKQALPSLIFLIFFNWFKPHSPGSIKKDVCHQEQYIRIPWALLWPL